MKVNALTRLWRVVLQGLEVVSPLRAAGVFLWRRVDCARPRSVYIAAGAVFLWLALGRAWSHLFGTPYLYMEQATVYYRFAYVSDWWPSLLSPHQGYCNLWINFVTTVAEKILPMEAAPYAMTVGGTLVGAVVAALLFAPGCPLPGFASKLLALVVMAFVPPAEDRFSITYAHFYMAVAVALVLVSDAKSEAERMWQRRALVFSVLCGPVSLWLIPVYGFAYLQRRERERLVQVGILSAGVLLQLAGLAYSRSYGVDSLMYDTGGSRFQGIGELDVLLLWLYERLLVYPFSDWRIFHTTGIYFIESVMRGGFAHWLLVLGASMGLGGWTMVALGEKREGQTPVTLWLVLSIAAISVGNFFCSAVVGNSKMYLITTNHRYFLAQAMLVGFVFVFNAAQSRVVLHRVLYGVLVAVMLVVGVNVWRGYSSVAARPISWAYEVQVWRKNPSYALRIMPPGHTVRLF